MFRRAVSLAPPKVGARSLHSSSFAKVQSSFGLIEPSGKTAKKYEDRFSKHKSLVTFGSWRTGGTIRPAISDGVFVAPDATIAGNVELFPRSSVWYGVSIKADVNLVRVGAWSNIQDNCTVHEALAPLDDDHDGSTIIGHYVTIGHDCHLRACTIEDFCLVGMGSILEEGSYMETKSMLGAGSVLKKGTRIPAGELWLGNPAKFVRMVSGEEMADRKPDCNKYHHLAVSHLHEFYLPNLETLLEAEKFGLLK